MSVDREELATLFAGAGYSTKTCRVYSTALAQVAAAIAGDGHTLDDMPAIVLRRYSDTLPRTRSSRALLRSALTAYWRLVDRHHPPIAAIRVPSKPRMVCRALEPAVATRLATAARARRDRKGLAVLVALYTGLRRSEIASLRWSDIDQHGWLTIVGKGDVTGTIPVHPVVLGAMADLRCVLTPADTQRPKVRHGADWVFPGRGGGHMNPTTLYNHVRDVAFEAGLPSIPVHVLRHTCLATALDITRDLRAVQELARHARPETTAGYTRVKRDRLVETVTAICYEEAS